MNFKGHLLGGIVSYALILFLLKLAHFPLDKALNLQWFLFCLLGALFPDIDTKSKIQLWIYRLFFVFYLILLVNNPSPQILIFVGILAIIPLIVHHRGLFHKPLFLIGMPLAIVALIYSLKPPLAPQALLNAIFFIVGTLSHLMLDRAKRH